MKKATILFAIISLLAITANTQERGPVAVSPGSDTGIARVGTNCPTFSWTGMEWATGYKVVVFETNGPNVLDYKEIVAISSPVLKREIKGRALSWTPSSDERLSSGGTYVWYVQAVNSYGTGMWSEGQVFKVEVEVQLFGIEESIRNSLAEHGVSEDVIEDALKDMRLGMREVTAYGVAIEGNKTGSQNLIGIQGSEGTLNTFYGYLAGFNNTGNCNSFFGSTAGYSNTTGNNNSFLGHLAGYSNTTGYENTFMGSRAGFINQTGNRNTFIGHEAGYSFTTGHSNLFIGHEAGHSFTTGHANTFIGQDAGYSKTTGIRNTFIGQDAGYSNTTGEYNTFIGGAAGYSNTNGTGNVFLGHQAGLFETGDYRLYIDNSDTSTPLIWGNFANNILTVHGKLGVGTKSPAYAMELETTGTNAAFVAQRTDGATNYINATAGFGNFGTVTNHPLRLAVNSVWRMRLDSDNSLTMANGAMCTAGGTWQNYSKREAKENIHDLTTEEAMDTLQGLVAVKYNYKVDKEEKHVGFIAEDVPELVASKDRNGISAMDIVAVLTKVVQEQQKIISELQRQIDDLKIREK